MGKIFYNRSAQSAPTDLATELGMARIETSEARTSAKRWRTAFFVVLVLYASVYVLMVS
jgi:hypothetical protein